MSRVVAVRWACVDMDLYTGLCLYMGLYMDMSLRMGLCMGLYCSLRWISTLPTFHLSRPS